MTNEHALRAAILHIVTSIEAGEVYSVSEDEIVTGDKMLGLLAKFGRAMLEEHKLVNWAAFAESRLASWKRLGWNTSAIDPN